MRRISSQRTLSADCNSLARRFLPLVETRTGQMTFWGFKPAACHSTLFRTSHARGGRVGKRTVSPAMVLSEGERP